MVAEGAEMKLPLDTPFILPEGWVFNWWLYRTRDATQLTLTKFIHEDVAAQVQWPVSGLALDRMSEDRFVTALTFLCQSLNAFGEVMAP